MAEFHIGVVFVVHFLYNLAPKNTGFHDISFFHGTDFVVATTRKFKGAAGNAVNFAFRVALRIDADAFIAFFENSAGFPEIHTRG